ncbi:MAG: M48 family metalloprotease [Lewinellaceae bacterium]|nr:M48 family metalloprotease [Lewinellaceae bacterium]
MRQHLFRLLALFLLLLLSTRCRDAAGAPSDAPAYRFPYRTVVSDASTACELDAITRKLITTHRTEERELAKHAISRSEQEAFAGEMFSYIQGQFRFVATEDERSLHLQSMLDRMLPHLQHPKAYEVYLVHYPRPNAFTTAGNKIYFTTGLYEMAENEDELAMIMGHELGHQENFHVLEHLQKIKKWEDKLSFRFFDLEIDWSENAEVLAILDEVLSIPFNQADELEADLAGCYLAYMAGFDPERGKDVFEKFRQMEGSQPRGLLENLACSHPESVVRFRCLREYIQKAKDRAERVELRKGRSSNGRSF